MLDTKKLKNLIYSQSKDLEENNVLEEARYICKSGALITESLERGSDIMQMPNGDIIVSEMKAVTFYYAWDKVKGNLVRLNNTAKLLRRG
jgi:hypothetical protein